jgi:hypothetical protein
MNININLYSFSNFRKSLLATLSNNSSKIDLNKFQISNSEINSINENTDDDYIWLETKLDEVLDIDGENQESLYGEYQSIIINLLDRMLLKRNVVNFKNYLDTIISEFIELPETADLPKNNIHEGYAVHMSVILEKLIEFYAQKKENNEFYNQVLDLIVDLNNDKLLSDDLIKTGEWRIEMSFDESFYAYKRLKKLDSNSKIGALHKRLIFFNETFIKEISNHEYLVNNLDLNEERYISDTGLIFDEGEIMDFVHEMPVEDDDQKSKKIDILFKLFKILFIGGDQDYALSNTRLTINNLIAGIEDRKILDTKLSEFSKLLVSDEIIDKDDELKAFDYSLHFASSISNRYFRCNCGKYSKKEHENILCDLCHIVVSKYGHINGTFKEIFNQMSRLDKHSTINKVSITKIIDKINDSKNDGKISLLVVGLESLLTNNYIITDLINNVISKTENISFEEKFKPQNLDKQYDLVKELFNNVVSNSNQNKTSFRELSSMLNRLIVNYYKNNKQKQINLCIDDFFKLIDFSDQRTIKSFAVNMLEQNKVDLSLKSLKFLEHNFLKDYCDFIAENYSMEDCFIFLNKMKKNKVENPFSLDSKLLNSSKNDDFLYLCNFKDNKHHLNYYVVYEFFKESQKNIIDQKKTDFIKQLFSDDKLMIT